ncbi:MAG: hypothetical protein KC594_19055 [Nitrospira sp.]|nr:hypothetical protein [Nitrospira sp.]
MRRHISNAILPGLVLVSIFFALKSSPEPIPISPKYSFIEILLRPLSAGNSIVFGLSMGFLVSSIFYWLVVFLPEKKRRRIIGANLQSQYREFRVDCIAMFLSAMRESWPAELPQQLTGQKAFKDYFKAPYNESQSRWDRVLSGLDDYHLKSILTELEILREAVLYALNNIEVGDDDVFTFFHRLSRQVHKFRNTNQDYDDVKSLSHFLWELFAGWSFIDGYRDEDIVEVMIDKVT